MQGAAPPALADALCLPSVPPSSGGQALRQCSINVYSTERHACVASETVIRLRSRSPAAVWGTANVSEILSDLGREATFGSRRRRQMVEHPIVRCPAPDCSGRSSVYRYALEEGHNYQKHLICSLCDP